MNKGLFGASLGFFQHFLKGEVIRLRQIVAQWREHGAQSLGLFRGRFFVHTVNGGLLKLMQMLRHRLVGDEHAFLDEGFRNTLGARLHPGGLSRCVTADHDLAGLEIQAAPVHAFSLERGSQSREIPEHGKDVGVFLLQRRVRAREQDIAVLIGHTPLRADDAF
ncbi:hypothetical protein SDC9_171254 [bioreactor metagenome]|uniref:Uncharacterized protein n=1 Tax=bioreactor metagenome TaxID=1076179 RepID=A0A645GAD4_9ZZZZ